MKGNRQEAVGSRRSEEPVGAIQESSVPLFLKGADLSSLLEVEECGGRFYDQTANPVIPSAARNPSSCAESADSSTPLRSAQNDNAESALTILKRHGLNLVRLRLWNDPYAADGTPYGAGTNDLPRTIEMARRCRSLGLPWLLDFHYSDFWADPGKQMVPKAWRGFDEEGLAQALYEFTKQTLETLQKADLLPCTVAPGNELSNGFLWPVGKVPNYPAIARLLSSAIRAIREVDPSIAVMLHLDNGGSNALYRSWFDAYLENGGAAFDCIGLSYYPFWHGTLDALRKNLNDLALRYGKPLVIAETSTAFTLEDCSRYEGLSSAEKRGLAANETTARAVPYPMTPDGQCAFLRDLATVLRQVPNGLGRGLIWWEPAWLPVKGSHWTTEAGLAYIQEKGPGGNEWANQGLFDYDGVALPALSLLERL